MEQYVLAYDDEALGDIAFVKFTPGNLHGGISSVDDICKATVITVEQKDTTGNAFKELALHKGFTNARFEPVVITLK